MVSGAHPYALLLSCSACLKAVVTEPSAGTLITAFAYVEVIPDLDQRSLLNWTVAPPCLAKSAMWSLLCDLGYRRDNPKKPLTRVSKPVPGAHGKRGMEKRLAKGWRRVGEGLADFLAPPISEFLRRPFRDTGL